jgi:hypothetical protein
VRGGLVDAGEDLVEIAGGDRARVWLLKGSLRCLADGAGGAELQEMARDVIDGRVDLRAVMLSASYSNAIQEKTQAFAAWFNDLTPEEREAQAAMGRETLMKVREQIDRDERER